jgi:hypothetical protein
MLGRLLRHAETVIVEGKNYCMKDQIETRAADRASRPASETPASLDASALNHFSRLLV